MSTLTVPTHPSGLGRNGALARGLALLHASHGGYGRWLAVLLYALFTGLGVILLLFARRPDKGLTGLVIMVGLATAILWALWFARLALLHVEAREGRLPTLARDVPSGLALAFVASVLLPALALTGLGAPLGVALQALSTGALAGLGLALLPVGAYTVLSFTPLVVALLNRALTAQFGPGFWSSLGLHPVRFELSWVLIALGMLAMWRWRAVVRGGKEAHASLWRRPLIAAKRGPLLWMAGVDADANLWRAAMPEWLWPSGKATAGPGQVLHAMRSWLGTPFAPMHARQVVLQLVLVAGLLAMMMLGGSADSESKLSHSGMVGGLVGGVAGGAAVLVTLYAWRLEQLRRSVASELAELALLPGWGDATQARRALLHAAAYSPLRAWAVLSALLCGTAMLTGLGAATLLLLGTCLVTLALVMAMACLRPLAGQPLVHWFPIVLIVLAMLLCMVSLLIYSANPERSPGPGLFLGFALLSMATVAALWDSWGRFTARAHPFLQD